MNGMPTSQANELVTAVQTLQQWMEQGFAVAENIYTQAEVEQLTGMLEAIVANQPTSYKAKDVFAIRHLLQEVSQLKSKVFNNCLLSLINSVFGRGYFVVKSIYFDKPATSNWFVAYHQDLTLSVKGKHQVAGFGPWTVKGNQFAVQPPVELLQDNFTVRIHLDDTDEQNGALKVVPTSHLWGIVRPEAIRWQQEKEIICPVPKGGIMLMRPLLLHASGRTTNDKRRRVIHIEFSNMPLPAPLQWAECLEF
jgi:ectoine hydroxylase-related dioxygenase (phytanoyl-CoA dioxygenase family)